MALCMQHNVIHTILMCSPNTLWSHYKSMQYNIVHFFHFSLSFHSASSFLHQWPQLFLVQKLSVWRSLKQPLCSLKANSTMRSRMMRWHHCSLKAAGSSPLRVYQHKMSITIAWRRRALHYSTVQEIRFRFTATARDTDNTKTHTHTHEDL